MLSASHLKLLVPLAVGIPAFVGSILVLVFTLVGRATARQRAELEQEGVVLDSGPQWITIRFSNFRAPGVYTGAGITKRRASLVLTRKRLVVTPARRQYYSVAHADLTRFTAGIATDGALHLHSDSPPGASGSIAYRIPVQDAGAWVHALTELGARPEAALV